RRGRGGWALLPMAPLAVRPRVTWAPRAPRSGALRRPPATGAGQGVLHMRTIDRNARSADAMRPERLEGSVAGSVARAVPAAPLRAVLREHLAAPTVRLTDLHAEPIAGDGFSGSALHRVSLAWTSRGRADGRGSATWVLKRWRPGGHSERLLGVTQSL